MTIDDMLEFIEAHFSAQISLVDRFSAQTIEGITHVVELNNNSDSKKKFEETIAQSFLESTTDAGIEMSGIATLLAQLDAGYVGFERHCLAALRNIELHSREGAERISSGFYGASDVQTRAE